MAIVAEPRELEESPLEPKNYRTNIEAIMGIGIYNQDSRQLLRSLNKYLNSPVENLTKEEYNRVNRDYGPGYEKLLEEGMKRGEVSREDVLRINNEFNQRMWDQYNKITGKPQENKMALSYERWTRADERNKTLKEVINRQNEMIINAKRIRKKSRLKDMLKNRLRSILGKANRQV